MLDFCRLRPFPGNQLPSPSSNVCNRVLICLAAAGGPTTAVRRKRFAGFTAAAGRTRIQKTMKYKIMSEIVKKKAVVTLSFGAMALLLGATFVPSALADDNRAPDVPHEITVDLSTNKVHFHGLGIGSQVYTWNGTNWGTAVPDATLYDSDGNVVASHFAGPSWQSNSGSKVVGTLDAKVTVNTNAIAWLRLVPVSTQGPGIFAEVSFIHRVNTVGGLPPAAPGLVVGQVAKVPYMADYFFYRAD